MRLLYRMFLTRDMVKSRNSSLERLEVEWIDRLPHTGTALWDWPNKNGHDIYVTIMDKSK